MITRAEQQKTKLRFAVIYTLSLLLAFVVTTAFWQKLSSKNSPDAAPQTAETEKYFMQLDTALHAKAETLGAMSKAYVKGRQAGTEPDLTALLSARSALRGSLDSIDQQAAYLNEGPKKTAMNLAVSNFRKELDEKENLLNGITVLPKAAFNANTSPSNSATANNDEVESLKRLLQQKDETIAALQKESQLNTTPSSGSGDALQKAVADKDKLIASLQTQLKQKEAASQNASTSGKTASGGEWQQKYQSLKAAFDKVSASEKSLKNSYQTLADDNRRLLSQLQSARKG